MLVAEPTVYLRDVGGPEWDMTNNTRPHPETWRDPPWSRPDSPEPEQLLTREQLVAQLQQESAQEIPDRTLRNWHGAGIVPRPIRRWHEGRPASLYAPWVVDLIIFASALRAAGLPLDTIRETIRNVDWPTATTTTATPPADPQERSARVASYLDALDNLVEEIQHVASLSERAFGIPILAAQLRFFSAHGDRKEHNIPLASKSPLIGGI